MTTHGHADVVGRPPWFRGAARRWALRALALALAGTSVSCRQRDAPTQTEAGEVLLSDRLERIAKNLVELDVDAARTDLDALPVRHVEVARLRARLALALGDCEGASALLATLAKGAAAPLPAPMDPASELRAVADGCARAMAGARVIVDEKRGVWVRFQNPRDEALMPLIADAADRAATAIGKHLRTSLPRPLRIELVSDLFSLAKVTGLPLEAAETTGTIAIARWGKVTLVSPRATPEGYPWQDTLAHELTHLLVARQSSDAAPLWLQEGVAKREETRWRDALPFDGTPDPHQQARKALLEGRSIGIDRLGASMALLPTPEAAETAYAEVNDFLDYWIAVNGEAALVLLLRDLAAQSGDGAERAMLSVSGYGFRDWMMRWQRSLLGEQGPERQAEDDTATKEHHGAEGLHWNIDVARRARLAELLLERKHVTAAAERLKPLEAFRPMPPELAHPQALTRLVAGDLETARQFIVPERVTHLDGTWLAMRGRILAALGDHAGAELAFQQSLAFAPTLEKVACHGFFVAEPAAATDPLTRLPGEPWLSLCRSARAP